MSDLISRQAAIDLWEKYHPTIAVDAMQYDAELRQLPHIQTEIVRCKDCQDYQTDWNPSGKTCRHYCATMDSFMLPDGFCSYAERREVTT